jgi:hypothetical protein
MADAKTTEDEEYAACRDLIEVPRVQPLGPVGTAEGHI